MFEAMESPWRLPFDGSFRLDQYSTTPPQAADTKQLKSKLRKEVRKIYELQRVMYADNRYSLLLVFQAMDAAGKDSTIRHVLSGVNPAGCQIYSFKQPSQEELDHDFLWRTGKCLPERGRIGVFNRSYYEEVLVARVHPEILQGQRLPHMPPLEELWPQRMHSILELERHLVRNGTVILKFWLNVSREEQKQRFLARLDEPRKHWKFSPSDVDERELWPHYMHAYEQALAATSRAWAPWYAIPADDKPFMRLSVARLIRKTMESLDMHYPEVRREDEERFGEMRQHLENE